MDIARLNWFLGFFAVEVWLAAWFIAYEPELRGWFQRRVARARSRRLQATQDRATQERATHDRALITSARREPNKARAA